MTYCFDCNRLIVDSIELKKIRRVDASIEEVPIHADGCPL